MSRVVVWDNEGKGKGYSGGEAGGALLIGAALFSALGAVGKAAYDVMKAKRLDASKKEKANKLAKRKAEAMDRLSGISKAFNLNEDQVAELRRKIDAEIV